MDPNISTASAQPGEQPDPMTQLISDFKSKMKIREEKRLKERQERQDERKKRREQGEEEVSSDTDDEYDIKDLSEEEKQAHRDKKAKETEEKLVKNAEIKFTYDQLVDGLKNNKYKKIVVVTGAGISVAAGIPDFRSPKTGLYANLSQYNLPRPESMFDIEYFKEKPEAFYHLAKEFLDLQKYMPTPAHHFIKLLDDKKLLQINMTQNIDNLEEKTGLDMAKVAQAHGANVGASCAKCKQAHDRDKLNACIQKQEIMKCHLDYTWTDNEIYEKDEKGWPKYSEDGKPILKSCTTHTELCNGPVKPNIVFFGEPMHPSFRQGCDLIRNKERGIVKLLDEEPKQLFEHGGCDLMIIIGTALAVFPFNSVVHEAEESCPKVLINLENLEHNYFDFDNLLEHPERLLLQGRAQDTIKKLCKDVGWSEELQALVDECEKKYGKKPQAKTEESKQGEKTTKQTTTSKPAQNA